VDDAGLCQNNVLWYTGGAGTVACDDANGAPDIEANASRHSEEDDAGNDGVYLQAGIPFVGTPSVQGALSDWGLDSTAGEGEACKDITGGAVGSLLADYRTFCRIGYDPDNYDIGAVEAEASAVCSLASPTVTTGASRVFLWQ
jgi:hypothetical protein